LDPEAATADVVPAGAAADAPDERSTTRPASGRRRAITVGLALFGASLLLRLVVLSAVVQQRLAPLFDERGYYEQAVGFGEEIGRAHV